jgi:hypothetical protein
VNDENDSHQAKLDDPRISTVDRITIDRSDENGNALD